MKQKTEQKEKSKKIAHLGLIEVSEQCCVTLSVYKLEKR